MENPEQPAIVPDPEDGRADDADSESGEGEPAAIRAAARVVEEAKARLHEAHARYAEVCEQAQARLDQVRETRVGDVIDGLLAFVRKHPGPGVILALLAGIFLGRKLRW